MVANLYKKKNLKLEDLYKAQEYISVFDKATRINFLQDNDLNHYKSLSDMYLTIRCYLKQPESKSERTRQIKQNEAEILYEDNTFVVIYPKTRAASCLYGKGTQWCTASKTHNYFSRYNSQGKLYIIINKINGKKYQFHAESDSFMDETDSPITIFFYKTITDGLYDYLLKEIPSFLSFYNNNGSFSLMENLKKEAEIKAETYRRFGDKMFKEGSYNQSIIYYNKAREICLDSSIYDTCIEVYESFDDWETVKIMKDKKIIAENNYENSVLPF